MHGLKALGWTTERSSCILLDFDVSLVVYAILICGAESTRLSGSYISFTICLQRYRQVLELTGPLSFWQQRHR